MAFYPSGLIVNVPCELVSVIRVLQRPFCMPDCSCIIPLFVVFGGSAMRQCRKRVQLGGPSVCFVRGVSSFRSVDNPNPMCTRRANFHQIGVTPLAWLRTAVISASAQSGGES